MREVWGPRDQGSTGWWDRTVSPGTCECVDRSERASELAAAGHRSHQRRKHQHAASHPHACDSGGGSAQGALGPEKTVDTNPFFNLSFGGNTDVRRMPDGADTFQEQTLR